MVCFSGAPLLSALPNVGVSAPGFILGCLILSSPITYSPIASSPIPSSLINLHQVKSHKVSLFSFEVYQPLEFVRHPAWNWREHLSLLASAQPLEGWGNLSLAPQSWGSDLGLWWSHQWAHALEMQPSSSPSSSPSPSPVLLLSELSPKKGLFGSNIVKGTGRQLDWARRILRQWCKTDSMFCLFSQAHRFRTQARSSREGSLGAVCLCLPRSGSQGESRAERREPCHRIWYFSEELLMGNSRT